MAMDAQDWARFFQETWGRGFAPLVREQERRRRDRERAELRAEELVDFKKRQNVLQQNRTDLS